MSPSRDTDVTMRDLIAQGGSIVIIGDNYGNLSTPETAHHERLTKVIRPVRNFCGRKSQLAEIFEAFQADRVVVVTGLLGIGKTELARKFCDENDYELVIWQSCASPKILEDSLNSLSKNCETSNRDEMYDFLTAKKCLFVFDDAEEWVVDFLPSYTLKGNIVPSILITSASTFQRSDLIFEKLNLSVSVLELEGLDPLDAAEFFKMNLDFQWYDSQDTAILAQKLFYHPFFLHSAILAIMNKYPVKKKGKSTKSYNVKKFLENFSQNLTFLKSPKFIDSALKKLSPSNNYECIVSILNALTFLRSDAVPEALLEKISSEYRTCCEELEKYFLVVSKGGTVSTNPLIQLVNKEKLRIENKNRAILEFWSANLGIDSGSSVLDDAVRWGSLDLVKFIVEVKKAPVTVDVKNLAARVAEGDILNYLLGCTDAAEGRALKSFKYCRDYFVRLFS